VISWDGDTVSLPVRTGDKELTAWTFRCMNTTMKRLVTAVAAAGVFATVLTSCSTVGQPEAADEIAYGLPSVAVSTTATMVKLVAEQRLSPLSASRVYGYTLAAAHDAFTQADIENRDADAATAAALTGIAMFSSNDGAREEFNALALKYTPGGLTEAGRLVADRWIEQARDDNTAATAGGASPVNRTDEWGWVPTGLLRMTFVDPGWGQSKPIIAATATCDIDAPNLEAMRDELPMLFDNFDVGETADPRVFAFLAGNSTPTPPGQWMQMGMNLVRDAKLNDAAAMNLLAQLGVAAYDVSILIWREKAEHMIARPETMYDRLTGKQIQLARETPPHPSYPSGHSGFSGAAAGIISSNYPNNGLRLNLPEDLGVQAEVWTVANAHDALRQISDSRVIARFHFRADTVAGEALGDCVAKKVSEAFTTGASK